MTLNNFKSKLLDLLKKKPLKINFDSQKILCQSGQAKTFCTFHSDKITYDSASISEKLVDNLT